MSRLTAAPLRVLRATAGNPALARVQVAWCAVVVGSWAATVTLSVVAYDRGGSPAVAAAVLARTVPVLLLGPVLGALVDRGRHTRTMAVAALVGAAACAGAAASGDSLVAVVALVLVATLGTTAFRTTQYAVLPALVADPVELTGANVLAGAAEAAGVFAGPGLAGLLLAAQGPGLAFGVAGGLFVGAALLTPRSGPAARTPVPPPGSRGSTRLALRAPSARHLLLLVLAQTVVSGGLAVLYPAIAVDLLGAAASRAGLLNAAYGLGGAAGSLALFALAGSRRLGLLNGLALLLWSLPLLLVATGPLLAGVVALLAVVGLGNVLFDVTCVTLLQRIVPPHLLGRAFGVLETVVVAGLGVGAVAAPLLDRWLGVGAALAVLAAFLVVVALAALPGLRRLDRRVAAPAAQVARLRGLAPFALLPPPELEALALRLQARGVPAGGTVVRQGDTGREYLLVEAGRLAVSVDGRPVGELGPGDGLGEVALLRSGVRTATVTARTPATLWALDGDVFLSALRGDGGRALEAADAVARERLARAAPGTG